MKYLFRHWDKIKGRLKGKGLFLFLDYDGTLTPIVKTPKDAVIPVKNRTLLDRLRDKPNLRLAIISGRALSDVVKRVGIRGIIYAGNHGLEIQGPGIRFTAPMTNSIKKAVRDLNEKLKAEYSRFKGVFVEDKGLTVSVHYRLADTKDFNRISSIFNKNTAPYIESGRIRIGTGKKVFEIKPNIKWDKGDVVSWFISTHKDTVPIYLGDDITDDDAFKVLKRKGLTVFVGKPRRLNAEYYLKNTREVTGFLKQIYGAI